MPKTVAEEYPELMHYTSDVGLTGIVKSGCLWATDARHLNDAQELTHFFDARLRELALPEIDKALREIANNPAKAANMVLEGSIDHLVRVHAEQTWNGLREVVLDINRPFIFSLSGTHEPRILHNGLLSQWVVAIPAKPEYAEQANTAGELRLQKPILTYVRKDDDQKVPYIELFRQPSPGTDGARLPIKRVIVGPHKDAVARVAEVQRLLAENDYDVPVVRSEIPYLGR